MLLFIQLNVVQISIIQKCVYYFYVRCIVPLQLKDFMYGNFLLTKRCYVGLYKSSHQLSALVFNT